MTPDPRFPLRLEISRRIAPAYEGRSFGEAGAYGWVLGRLHGQVDPRNPLNAPIALLADAPADADGQVSYAADVALLAPLEPERGNGWLLYDVLNRGTKRAIQRIDSAPAANEPFDVAQLGTASLLRRGFSLLWTGWQGDVPPGNGRMTAQFPVATRGGAPILGRCREEFILDMPAPVREDGITELSPELFHYHLSYPAADLADLSGATLTLRRRAADARQSPPGLRWRYLDASTIEVQHPATPGFDRGAIFEFTYTARDPVVMGLGLAAMRDAVSFLRYGEVDAAGQPNPLAGRIRHALGFGLSQSGRVLRDFLHEGFNEDLGGRRVFDGVMPLIAGSRRAFLNAPFSQPGRFSRQHEDHDFPGDQFPFAYDTRHDPVSGETDGILRRAERSGTVPRIMHVDTDSEFFSARSSLVVTDSEGRDVPLDEGVRFFLAASVAHGDYPLPPEIASAAGNTLTYAPLVRALVAAMVDWVEHGIAPPESRYPTRAAGTLLPLERAAQHFPTLPGAGFPQHLNALHRMDHDEVPPRPGAAYAVLVPAVDADGNSRGGVPHPLNTAPTGTFTGWQVRRHGFAPGELFNVFGSHWPFALDRAARDAAGDPRPSLEERYGHHGAWHGRLSRNLQEMVEARLLLPEDRTRILALVQEGFPTRFNAF